MWINHKYRWIAKLLGVSLRPTSQRHRNARIRLHIEYLESRIPFTAYTWTCSTTGNPICKSAANWNPDSGFPNGASDTANFTSPLTISMNTLTLNTTDAFTLQIAPSGGSLAKCLVDQRNITGP